MTHAEELDTAADKLDALASGASDGPWRDLLMGSEGSKVLAGGNTVSTARHIALARGSGDATYIAAMHPLVGESLAELLREQSVAAFVRHGHSAWALNIARLINGGAS